MNCVDDFLNEHIHSDSPFLLGRTEQLSYSGLCQKVMRTAQWMETHIGRGKMVLLLAPNSIFFIVAYLSIMKSGNVVVPLNPAIEKDQFEYIKGQCESEHIIIARQVKRRLGPEGQCYDEEYLDKVMSGEDRVDWKASPVNKQNIAQIIFTSGSTALPKGVMLSHGNLMANTSSIVHYLKLSAADVMEVVLPFFYCYGLSLLHTHMKVGAALVLNNTFIFLGSVIDDLEKYKCTGFAGVPSHFQILLRKSDSFKQQHFPHLKYVTQAGGKLHTAFIKEFRECKPDILFYVMYGQTEATARLSYLPPELLHEKMGSLGRGIPGVELRVVNAKGHPVRPGEVGEIIASGDNVMPGYLNDAEETARALRKGWLYTGDLATVDEEGYIYHAARRKEMIKVGGKRVSPKEIEAVIVTMPGVIDCTVEAVNDDLLGEAVKATVVLNRDFLSLGASDIKAYCAAKLTSYKVPGIVEFKANVDVNAAGKKVKKL